MAQTLAGYHLARARPGSPPRVCAERASAAYQAVALLQGFELGGTVAALAGEVNTDPISTVRLVQVAEALAQGCGEAAERELEACVTELEAAFDRREAACAGRGFPAAR
ncbi:MAG: hypothetical protein ABMA64_10815 [Myxococcota bacterium]